MGGRGEGKGSEHEGDQTGERKGERAMEREGIWSSVDSVEDVRCFAKSNIAVGQNH